MNFNTRMFLCAWFAMSAYGQAVNVTIAGSVTDSSGAAGPSAKLQILVTTSNYEVDLGLAGGALMNVTLKSGPIDFHGSVHEFNRVSRLAARERGLRTSYERRHRIAGGCGFAPDTIRPADPFQIS